VNLSEALSDFFLCCCYINFNINTGICCCHFKTCKW